MEVNLDDIFNSYLTADRGRFVGNAVAFKAQVSHFDSWTKAELRALLKDKLSKSFVNIDNAAGYLYWSKDIRFAKPRGGLDPTIKYILGWADKDKDKRFKAGEHFFVTENHLAIMAVRMGYTAKEAKIKLGYPPDSHSDDEEEITVSQIAAGLPPPAAHKKKKLTRTVDNGSPLPATDTKKDTTAADNAPPPVVNTNKDATEERPPATDNNSPPQPVSNLEQDKTGLPPPPPADEEDGNIIDDACAKCGAEASSYLCDECKDAIVFCATCLGGQHASNNHLCDICKKPNHIFCGDPIGEESSTQTVRCRKHRISGPTDVPTGGGGGSGGGGPADLGQQVTEGSPTEGGSIGQSLTKRITPEGNEPSDKHQHTFKRQCHGTGFMYSHDPSQISFSGSLVDEEGKDNNAENGEMLTTARFGPLGFPDGSNLPDDNLESYLNKPLHSSHMLHNKGGEVRTAVATQSGRPSALAVKQSFKRNWDDYWAAHQAVNMAARRPKEYGGSSEITRPNCYLAKVGLCRQTLFSSVKWFEISSGNTESFGISPKCQVRCQNCTVALNGHDGKLSNVMLHWVCWEPFHAIFDKENFPGMAPGFV